LFNLLLIVYVLKIFLQTGLVIVVKNGFNEENEDLHVIAIKEFERKFQEKRDTIENLITDV